MFKGISIRQTTAWLFKRKLQEAMAGFPNHLAGTGIEIQQIIFTGAKNTEEEEHCNPINKVSITATNNRKCIAAYAKIQSGKNQKAGLAKSPKRKLYKIEKFRSKRDLQNKKKSSVVQKTAEKKLANKIRPIADIIIIKRNWLNGIHHHCPERFLQGYLDEFFFRFNRRKELGLILHQVIERMINRKPYCYRAPGSK